MGGGGVGGWWLFHGVSRVLTGFPCSFLGFSMGFLWFFWDFSMGFLGVFYGVSMVFNWVLTGVSRVLLMFCFVFFVWGLVLGFGGSFFVFFSSFLFVWFFCWVGVSDYVSLFSGWFCLGICFACRLLKIQIDLPGCGL